MIISKQPLSMCEAKEFLNKKNEKEAELKAFIEKFTSLNENSAKDLREKIQQLNLLKVNEEHISKIIDILPKDSDDLNKIFTDIILDEDETKKILETIKEFK